MTAQNVALVTGGSAGIGAEICRQMVEDGYEVVSLDRRKSSRTHARLYAIEVDLLDADATAQAAAEAASRFPVTHLVHNAGAIRPALLPEVRLDDLNALAQLHLGSAIVLAQASLPAMKRNRFGRIVLLSSRGALGLASRTVYAATKSGIIGMARTWALELAGDGITVNVVAPGPISDTEMFESIVPKNSERERALTAQIPVRRLGIPEDVARAVMFFCHPSNGFITGQTLYVCGGASLGTLVV